MNVLDLPALSAVWREFHALISVPCDIDRTAPSLDPLDDLGMAAHRENCLALPSERLYSKVEQAQSQGHAALGPGYRVAAALGDRAASRIESDWIFSGAKYTLRPRNEALFAPLRAALRAVFGDEFVDLRGLFYYPPRGFREWHTNRFDAIGWRMYLTSVATDGAQAGAVRGAEGCGKAKEEVEEEEETGAFMHFKSPWTGELLRQDDVDGTLRVFKLSRAPLLWHCVYAGTRTHRWSCGVHLTDYGAWRLLAHAGRTSQSFAEFLVAHA